MKNQFEFFITSDINWETKVDKALDQINDIDEFFAQKNYGEDLLGITIIMMCRSPKLKFKQRKRYSKTEKKLYLDIMLDYNQMVNTQNDKDKAKILVQHLNLELPPVLDKYKFEDFNTAEFETDLQLYFKSKGFLKN